jgi:hypothetical protein
MRGVGHPPYRLTNNLFIPRKLICFLEYLNLIHMKSIRHIWLFSSLLSCTLFAQGPLWEAVPFTLNRNPRFFLEDTSTQSLLIGGNFWTIDDSTCNHLIRFDGVSYERLAMDRLNDFIETPLMGTFFQGELYIGGFGGLMKHDGQSWQRVESQQSVIRTSIHLDSTRIVFGGTSEGLGMTDINSVGAWDGTTWNSFHGVDSMLEGRNANIHTLLSYQGETYLAGNFEQPFSEIMRWNGQSWIKVGGGIPNGGLGEAGGMVIYKDELYVGGIFTKASGAPGNNIARWNGQRWDGLGEGIGNDREGGDAVYALYVFEDYLWVAGLFETAGGMPARNLARWDGERWCTLGSAFDNGLSAIGSWRDTLYVGGGFWSIDGDSSMNKVAKLLDPYYADTCSAPVATSVAPPATDTRLTAYPNPTQNQLRVQATFDRAQAIHWQVFDAWGQLVHEQHEWVSGGTWQQRCDLSAWPIGVYLIKLASETQHQVVKVIKQ